MHHMAEKIRKSKTQKHNSSKGAGADLCVARNRVGLLDGAAQWCHLANTTERSVSGVDAALCQITLIDC